MGLKKKWIRFSFRWRLFLGVLVLVWAIIAVMLVYQHRNEAEYRKRTMRTELSNIDQRIIFNYEKGNSVTEFVKFLGRYYQNTIYEDMRVSVFDGNDSLIAAIGEPLPADRSLLNVTREWDTSKKPTDMEAIVENPDVDRRDLFYYTAIKSNDGNIQVCTAMPYTFSISQAVTVGKGVWILVAVLTLVATVVVLLATRMFSRSITLLRDFARRVAEGQPVTGINELPHDELGDISRQIIRLYEERLQAVEKSEREHRVALHAVQEQSRTKRQLTNNINHELKTPLGIIRGYLDTIEQNPDLDEATRDHFMKRTRDNVERLCSLLNDVSTMTRLDEGSESIPISPVDFHELLYSIENDIEASGAAGKLKFSFDVPMHCVVQGNQGLLSGMVLNLVKNSALHSHGTKIELKMTHETERLYLFSFADDGVGVAPEHIPHLFERFYRVDSGRSRKVGGTGLGLPIVKNTIVALGGAMSVHNRSTGGLEFSFSLLKAKSTSTEEEGTDDSAEDVGQKVE